MTTAVFHRRRIERLAQLLDDSAGPGRHHALTQPGDELGRLVAVSQRVGTIRFDATPSTEFRDSLRAMLVATAERDGLGRTDRGFDAAARVEAHKTARSGWRSSRTRGAILIGIAAGAVALSGMSTASNGAMPGDPLYGVKRSAEKAQLALAGSDVNRGQLYLEFAETRLSEAKVVRDDPGQLKSVLNDMDSETRLGVKLLTTAAVDRHDLGVLDDVAHFAGSQRSGLSDATRNLTAGAARDAATSLALLDEVATRVDDLRTAMQCTSSPAPRTDALGPLPSTCEQAVAPIDPVPDPTTTSPAPTRRSSHAPTPSPSHVPSTAATTPAAPPATPAAPVTASPTGTPSTPIASGSPSPAAPSAPAAPGPSLTTG